MTVTKTGKENQEEEKNGHDYKLVSNNLNGQVEDIYKMSNNLNGQKKLEVKYKMKTEDDNDDDDENSIFCLPLKIRTKKDNFCPLSITNGTKENEEITDMVANLKIMNITEDRNDNENDDDDNEDTRRDTDEDEEDVSKYTERGPMGNGRLSRGRNHPYEMNNVSSPSSSNSGFDSESSNSSPDTSPRHSVSITIPSRPHYGSVGLVTVVQPNEQNRGAEGESPSVDVLGRKRHSLKHLSGGGLVVSEEQPSSSSAASPHSNPPNLPSPCQYPLLTVSNIPADSMHDQPQFVGADSLATLSVPSSYGHYRDPFSHSPLSVQSFSDESLALASPASDFSQTSPLTVDYQEQFHCSDGETSSSSSQPYLFPHGASAVVEKRRVSLPLEPQSFLTNNIYDLVSNLLDDFDFPDKNTDFAEITLCDSTDPVVASIASSLSDSYPALVPSLPRPPPPNPQQQQQQQRRIQRSSPIDNNLASNSRLRRKSKHDVQEEVNKILSSYPKIYPKLDPPSSSSSSSASSKPQTNPSPPLLLTLPQPQPPKFSDAVRKMRSMFSDHDRNSAIRSVEQMKIEQLCEVDKDGDTFLHVAVANRNYPFVYAAGTILGEKKRSVDMENNRRQTPLFVAVVGNNPTIVEYLLHYGANPDCICRDGLTPLQVAATRGDIAYDVAKLICDTGSVDFRRRNAEGFTALHLAVQSHGKVNCKRIVKLFLQKGASLTEEESCNGKTALHLAVEKGSVEMVRILCENGLHVSSAVNATTYVEIAPLHLAAMSKNLDEEKQLDIIKILLSYGANPNMKTKDYKLPRDLVAPDRNKVIQSLNFK